jgi:hypothetical protein
MACSVAKGPKFWPQNIKRAKLNSEGLGKFGADFLTDLLNQKRTEKGLILF